MWGAWCARCHAQDGTGKIDEPTVTVEPMDFTDCKLTTAEPDADWERAIAKGGPGVGLSPQMPGFEDSLTAEQITGFVSHIRGFCKETRLAERQHQLSAADRHRKGISGKRIPDPSGDQRTIASVETASALYERRLGKRSMFEFAVPADQNRRRRCTRWRSKSRSSTPSTQPSSFTSCRWASKPLPMQREKGRTDAIFEPFISAGTMLRDWYLQGQFKVELPIDRDEGGSRVRLQRLSRARHQRGAKHLDAWRRAERRESRARADAAGAQRPDRHRARSPHRSA